MNLLTGTIKLYSALRMRIVSAVNRTTFPPEGTAPEDDRIMYDYDPYCQRIWSRDPENIGIMGSLMSSLSLLDKILDFFLC